MSPHQTAEQIAAPYGFGVDEHAEIVGKITNALQAASNAELERRRERVAGLEAALKDIAAQKPRREQPTWEEARAQDTYDDAAAIGWDCAAWDLCEKAEAALSGGTSALDAVVAEATRKVAEERDALAAALDAYGTHKQYCVCRQFGVDGYGCDCGYAQDREQAWRPILSARDARVRAEGKREGLEEAYTISRGCHDYGGGYVGEKYDAYHHGMDTVGRVIQERLKGADDLQMRVVLSVGEAAQAGEVANAD